MEQPALERNWILLVSPHDVDKEYWRDRIQLLPRYAQKDPRITPFVGARLRQQPTLEKARREVELRTDSLPALVIVDAGLTSKTGPSEPGTATADFLNWLERIAPVPVFVVTENPPEPVLRCVLERPERLLWSKRIGESQYGGEGLAIALGSVATDKLTRHRRLIIEVAPHTVTYHLHFGQHLFSSSEVPYKSPSRIDSLVDEIAKFKPYERNRRVENWLDALSRMGIDAFDNMVTNSLGEAISTLIQRARDHGILAPDGGLTSMDLRFQFNLTDQLGAAYFSLPFELSCNAEYRLASRFYLCQTVPMARRLHLGPTNFARRFEQPASGDERPSKLLFIDANFRGSISFQSEIGGDDHPSVSLDRLQAVGMELDDLRTLEAQLDGRLVIEEAPALTGYRLLDKLEEMVTRGGYDIVHFCGHSASMGESTILVLPGEREGIGLELSIRLVGSWMKRGNCKLLVLSSCSGATARTALEVMRGGAAGVLAFRWPVEDKYCARFMKRFYAAYFDASNTQGLPEAYRSACSGAHDENYGVPTWASAMAVVRD
ncbi:CHAT domain-containing protein [Achromobacter sp. NPDC058515]|uniref:CHAT domain-containing protein n=1 Tax=Achromobacter sp. NPDC058515 TaxID=3346533 RepID=UPI00366485B6